MINIDDVYRDLEHSIDQAEERFENLRLTAHNKYHALKDEANEKIAGLNEEIERLKSRFAEFEEEKKGIQKLHDRIRQLEDENQEISRLQEQVVKLQQENEKALSLEREIQKLRNENARIKDEYRAWKDTLKGCVKKLGLF
ncbi:MAG: hypothetical protein ACI4VX_05800 [Succinivibrionaceae bacterium]